MSSAVAICEHLQAGRFDLSTEAACQADIEGWLTVRLAGEPVEREVRLSHRDRPDFMVAGVAIEVKMNGAAPAAIIRQLLRYAEHDAVKAIVLATNRAVVLPPSLNGKPVFSISLGRAWL